MAIVIFIQLNGAFIAKSNIIEIIIRQFSKTCKIEVQTVPGLKNKLLGGEGIFNTKITGPGKIYLQTMPINSVANSLIPFLPSKMG